MLEAAAYSTAYLTLVAILTFVIKGKYALYDNSRLHRQTKTSSVNALALFIVLSLIIGFRPLSYVFVDTMNYKSTYYTFCYGRPFQWDWHSQNFIFDNIFHGLGSCRADISVVFVVISFIYFGGLYLACRKLFPQDTLYAFVIYLGAFSTFSYATNGIKAGAAASLFLCAFAYKDKKILAILFLILSLGFHHSMTLPIGAYVAASFYKNSRAYFAFWILCILIAAAHITALQELFASMSDESGASYLSTSNSGFRTGFRPDFIFYSSFPVLAGYYAIFKHGYQSKFYKFLFNTYLLTNSIWMLCMYASFTNRIAYLSWFMLPIVLVYPFFDKEFVSNQYKKLNKVAVGHLMFTVLMQVVYYAFLK